MVNKFKLIFQDKIQLTDNTYHFIFTTDLEQGLMFKAGQFISLHIDKDGKEHRRNYSIANSPNLKNKIEIAIAYLPNGLASNLLANLSPGDIITASGPYGQFILKDEVLPQRYILIGTGTGITPYKSMLPDLSQLLTLHNLQVIILQGVRAAKDLLYSEDFVNFVDQNPKANFKACYSREYPSNPKSFEVSGYVQDQLELLGAGTMNDIIYLCGNPNMVDASFQKLLDLGVDRANIRREKYISSK